MLNLFADHDVCISDMSLVSQPHPLAMSPIRAGLQLRLPHHNYTHGDSDARGQSGIAQEGKMRVPISATDGEEDNSARLVLQAQLRLQFRVSLAQNQPQRIGG